MSGAEANSSNINVCSSVSSSFPLQHTKTHSYTYIHCGTIGHLNIVFQIWPVYFMNSFFLPTVLFLCPSCSISFSSSSSARLCAWDEGSSHVVMFGSKVSESTKD